MVERGKELGNIKCYDAGMALSKLPYHKRSLTCFVMNWI